MLDRFLKKNKPRVFLGKLSVAPRTDIKQHLEDWSWQPQENLGIHLQSSLENIFTLPMASDAKSITKQDIAIDVIVQKYQSGDFFSAHGGGFSFPVFWRPNVTVSARLYYLKSKKVKSTYTIKEKYPWGGYLEKLLQPQAFLGLQPSFNSKDLEHLLDQACYKLLLKIRTENDL